MSNNLSNSHVHIAVDMDGVIFSAENFIYEAYEAAIKKAGIGLNYPDTEEILNQIGKPVNEIFKNLFGDISEKQAAALLKETRNEICEMIKAGKGYIYEGMPEVIRELSKLYRLSICSNAGIKYIKTILEYYGLQNYFDPVLTLETIGVKNKNELLEAYILNSKTGLEYWVMIGDRRSDLDAARHNYIPFIGCLWGHGEIEELEGADAIIEKPESLTRAIKKVLK